MHKLVDATIALLGVWLVASAWWIGYGPGVEPVAIALAGLAIVAPAVGATRPQPGRLHPMLHRLGALLAVLLVATAIALPAAAAGARANAIAVGLVCLLVTGVALALDGTSSRFTLYAADGGVLMEVNALEFRGPDLALKGKMMGAMPTVAYVRPAEFRQALGMAPARVVLLLPLFVLRALRARA